MDAGQFYQRFEEGLAPSGFLGSCKRLAGKTSRWKAPIPNGALQFNFATNLKAAGLLDYQMWLGEFRLRVLWQQGRGSQKKLRDVSIFQYATDTEGQRYAGLQRVALEKFLSLEGKEQSRRLFSYASDPACVPRANIEEWCYYFDSDDAFQWGAWFGTCLPAFMTRFLAAPESLDDWCSRVLWRDAKRAETKHAG